jgi:hypothetical protein
MFSSHRCRDILLIALGLGVPPLSGCVADTEQAADDDIDVTEHDYMVSLPYRSPAGRNACSAGLGADKPCKPDAERHGIVPYANCVYGFHTGLSWGSGTAAFYDQIDRCAFLHDNGCWNINRFSWVDEGNGGCSQTVNFMACVDRATPATLEEASAKDCIVNSLIRTGADICEPLVIFGLPRGYSYPLYSGDDASNPKPVCRTGWLYP